MIICSFFTLIPFHSIYKLHLSCALFLLGCQFRASAAEACRTLHFFNPQCRFSPLPAFHPIRIGPGQLRVQHCKPFRRPCIQSCQYSHASFVARKRSSQTARLRLFFRNCHGMSIFSVLLILYYISFFSRCDETAS